MIYVCSDTHSKEIKFKSELEDIFIHCGDWEQGKVDTKARKILVRGNNDMFPTDGWDFVCDGLLLNKIWYTHEPAERLPKGAEWNICGHIHDGKMNDWGYEQKKWHILLPPNQILELDRVLWQAKSIT